MVGTNNYMNNLIQLIMKKENVLHQFIYPIITSILGGLLLSSITAVTINERLESLIINLVVFLLSFVVIYCTYKYFQKGARKHIKAIVFDFDGTLTKNNEARSSWEKIWVRLGYKVYDCQKYYQMYKAGDIDHQTWCDLTCRAFKKKNFSKDILMEIAKDIQLMEGAIEVLLKLKNEDNLKLYIVSGSIFELIENVFGDSIEDLFDGHMANTFIFHTNNKLSKIIGTQYDFEGKAEYIKKIVNDEGLESASEVLFIGNSDNDEYAYKSGAQTLCFNPRLTNGSNKKIWNKQFNADTYFDLYDFIQKNYIIE